jgi:hypothetical protein
MPERGDEGLDLAAAERLLDAAEVLREESGDVLWLLAAFAQRMEDLLPDHVEVTRRGMLRRDVERLAVRLGGDYFECRAARPGGGPGALRTFTASIHGEVISRRRPCPVNTWITRLERALTRELAHSAQDRDALNRLLP